MWDGREREVVWSISADVATQQKVLLGSEIQTWNLYLPYRRQVHASSPHTASRLPAHSTLLQETLLLIYIYGRQIREDARMRGREVICYVGCQLLPIPLPKQSSNWLPGSMCLSGDSPLSSPLPLRTTPPPPNPPPPQFTHMHSLFMPDACGSSFLVPTAI